MNKSVSDCTKEIGKGQNKSFGIDHKRKTNLDYFTYFKSHKYRKDTFLLIILIYFTLSNTLRDPYKFIIYLKATDKKKNIH
jgi:hypothetical protein